MCFYDSITRDCGCTKWHHFRLHCYKEYRIGETCGLKLNNIIRNKPGKLYVRRSTSKIISYKKNKIIFDAGKQNLTLAAHLLRNQKLLLSGKRRIARYWSISGRQEKGHLSNQHPFPKMIKRGRERDWIRVDQRTETENAIG
ncbi:hypothetical protein VTL71DRAFT_849, partial [Oculimacula yallundae]